MLGAWHDATSVWIRDGYGQTETGQLTGMPLGEPARPGSMGSALPGVRLEVDDGELVADPGHRSRPSSSVTSATTRRGRRARPGAPATASSATRRASCTSTGRTDDVIISAGYRIGPFEVESALVSHAAVAEAAVVAAPDDERGSVVRAVVVLRDGHAAVGRPRARAPGPRQGPDGAVQVPADRRLRRRAAEDGERQDPPRRAPRRMRRRHVRRTDR